MIKYIAKIVSIGLFLLLNCWIIGSPGALIELLTGALIGAMIFLELIFWWRND